MRIWFNKTFSTIGSVLQQLRQCSALGEVTLLCTHTHQTASAFLFADESSLEPADLTSSDYLHWCLQFCQSQRVDVFWVGKSAEYISQHRGLFSAMGTTLILTAETETLKLLSDKAAFYQQLPPTVAELMDFIAVYDAHSFESAVTQLSAKHTQLCVKPAKSVFGLGFRVLDTERNSVHHLFEGTEYHIPLAELRLALQHYSATFSSALLVMEYLAKNEWSVDCVARTGELLCAVQRKKALQAGHGQEIDNNASIQSMVERLTAHYQLNGLFNIQFREGEYGIRLLEINPRPSGGVGMACLAGVNLPALALQSQLQQPVTLPAIRYGLHVSEIHTAVILNV